mgnify:CR=1 FL=1|jgi:DNA-binding response OmpR family regulator
MKKILIVDDNFDDLKALETVLAQGGFVVGGVSKADRVINLLDEVHYDLVILDINMPSLSGYDLIKILKEKPSRELKIGFVTITPKKHVEHIEQLDLFIQKPFDAQEVLKQVKELLVE